MSDGQGWTAFGQFYRPLPLSLLTLRHFFLLFFVNLAFRQDALIHHASFSLQITAVSRCELETPAVAFRVNRTVRGMKGARESQRKKTQKKLLEPICRCLAPAAPLAYHRNGSRKHPKFKSSAVLVTLTYFRETWADSSRDAFFPLSFPQGRE